ncbi:hypothetical protein [Alkalihalobacillus deserti]|uniref:hypothetical protein n=1 Tax=Alkalihalobacillus deserti TaxID=2879466 RepID=UPI001D13D3F1|nr:hypothetical protein [Alkalihalobacillus deserti]
MSKDEVLEAIQSFHLIESFDERVLEASFNDQKKCWILSSNSRPSSKVDFGQENEKSASCS